MAMRGAAAVLMILLCLSCARHEEEIARTGGDPERGRELVHKYGCTGCHTIPGLDGADGTTGPHLDRISSRPMLLGVVPNTPENLVRMIRAPKKVQPHTSMPDMSVADQDARDLAAFLYTVR
jgi:cytochrome c2